MRQDIRGAGSQKGAATLAITLVVLLLITVITLFTARTLVTEQRVSANQYRTEQAEAAASAAMDLGTALFLIQQGLRADRNANGITGETGEIFSLEDLTDDTRSSFCNSFSVDLNGDGDTADTGETFPANQFRVLGITANTCDRLNSPLFALNGATAFITDPASGKRLPATVAIDYMGNGLALPNAIWGFGWSDDGTAQHRMTVIAGKTDATKSQPNPIGVTSYSAVSQGGNVNVFNFYNDDTIWSGDAVTAHGTPETYIRKPGSTEPVDCSLASLNPDTAWRNFVAAHGLLASKDNKVGASADIIENDPNLTALDEDEFWDLYFSVDPSVVREAAESEGHLYDASTGCPTNTTLDGESGTFWISSELNCTITNAFTVGSMERPSIFVVEGNFTLHTQGVFYGLVYIKGKLYTNAQTLFIGLLGVEDDRPATGNSMEPGGGIDVCVEPRFFSGELGIISSEVGLVPGTWRDWRVF